MNVVELVSEVLAHLVEQASVMSSLEVGLDHGEVVLMVDVVVELAEV